MDIQVDDPNLAALLGKEEGVEAETTQETPATPETNPVEEPAREEKPAEESKPEPKPADEDSETIAEDESGKRYVPEKRFNQVYAKLKAFERGEAQVRQPTQPTQPVEKQTPTDPNTALEVEILTIRYPQFDPNSDKYDQTLDRIGSEIYRANPGITRTEAARRALALQSELVEKVSSEKAQARLVKLNQSDSGITTRAQNKETSINPDDMSLEEMESYLKKNGSW